jgi:hypothetical protein
VDFNSNPIPYLYSQGREIFKEVVNRLDRIDISEFSSGIYTVKLTIEDFELPTQSFVVVR